MLLYNSLMSLVFNVDCDAMQGVYVLPQQKEKKDRKRANVDVNCASLGKLGFKSKVELTLFS